MPLAEQGRTPRRELRPRSQESRGGSAYELLACVLRIQISRTRATAAVAVTARAGRAAAGCGTARRPRADWPRRTRPLCETMTFCTMASPRPEPSALVVTKGLKMREQRLGGNAGAVVLDGDADVRPRRATPSTRTSRLDAVRGAGLDAVANQVAQRLAQEHLVTQDLIRTRRPPRCGRVRAAGRPRLARRSLRRSSGASASGSGRAKLRKLVTTSPIAVGLLPDALDVGTIRLGQLGRDPADGRSRGWWPGRS